MNAFFSGSLKVKKTTYPYMYPANVHRNNGTNVDPQNSTIQQAIYNMDYLIKGYVEKDVYEGKPKTYFREILKVKMVWTECSNLV